MFSNSTVYFSFNVIYSFKVVNVRKVFLLFLAIVIAFNYSIAFIFTTKKLIQKPNTAIHAKETLKLVKVAT